jgi:hypothetical protein
MRSSFLALALAAVLSAVGATAASAQSSDDAFKMGYMDVGPVIGLGNLGGANVSFGGRFETAIKDLPEAARGTLGLQVGVNYYHWDAGLTNYGITYLPIAVTVNYHFHLDNKKIDPFAGVGLGYQRVSISNCPISNCGYSSGGYGVGRAGILYFYMPTIALYADAGAGDAALNVGLMFKFGK